jgi:hypothetical protein
MQMLIIVTSQGDIYYSSAAQVTPKMLSAVYRRQTFRRRLFIFH